MTSASPPVQSMAVAAAMVGLPPAIQLAAISDRIFRRKYGLSTKATVVFSQSDCSFQRSELFAAVRKAFRAKHRKPEIRDQKGGVWQVAFVSTSMPPHVIFSKDEQQISNITMALLSPNKIVRLKTFEYIANQHRLPLVDRVGTVKLLTERAPDEDDMDEIQEIIRLTPKAIEEKFTADLINGNGTIDSVIPHSDAYYERLIGKHLGSASLSSLISGELNSFIVQETFLYPLSGYRWSLMLACQPLIVREIPSQLLDSATILRVWEEILEVGDIISLTAAIEHGLPLSIERPELRDPLCLLIDRVLAVTAEPDGAPYKALSAFFKLVYGEIAYSRTLATKPPFWRRLAAFAHASLMISCVLKTGANPAELVDWARLARGQPFVLQTLIDLRDEPRWLGELIDYRQLRNELGGRVLYSLTEGLKASDENTLSGKGLKEKAEALRSNISLHMAFLPGPLEGASEAIIEIPPEDLASMRKALLEPTPTIASFLGAANAPLLFRVPNDIPELAADALARANYYLPPVPELELFPCLTGLANLAAVARSPKLADALLVLLRNYRRFYPAHLELAQAFHVALMSCASRGELSDWCDAVGNCITEFSFQEISDDDAHFLHTNVTLLCHLVPELWARCGQAEAALRAFRGR